MKKSAPHSAKNDEITLEFPVEPDFVSHPLQVDPQAMLKRIGENMSRRKQSPAEAARRAAKKIDAEFEL